MPRHALTPTTALKARAARAHEDPVAMSADAYLGRLAKHVVALIKLNPDLTDAQLAKGARLRLRAEMAERAQQSAAARRARKEQDGDAAAAV
jgi:hypothetical protein